MKIHEEIFGVVILMAMLLLSFFVGRCTGYDEPTGATSDTLVVRDTIRVPHEKIETQLVTQEIVRYKYVPLTLTDTVVKTDTVVRVEDGVAVIPISLKTYTDSATYKAVVSGYDPRLEEIEVYQTNTVITKHEPAPRFSFGVQGGIYVTPKGLQPGVGFGGSYRIGK